MTENNPTLLTEAALRKHDILIGSSELRQFACGPCNRPWWTFVPRTKPVSHCQNCYVRYDALERNKEFGIGRYICVPCEHTFYARCEATEKHICFKCQKLVGPPFISPRLKPVIKWRPPESRFPYRRSTFVFPHVLQVINFSKPHDSTGSTVATFLTQDLGSDIRVEVLLDHAQAVKDQTKPEDVCTPRQSARHKYEEEGEDDNGSADGDSDDDQDSTAGEVGDLEYETEDTVSEVESSQFSDCESHEGTDSRRRSRLSDSDSSEDEDKESVQSSEPDSGIGTGSYSGTRSDVGTGSDAGAGSTTDAVASMHNYYVKIIILYILLSFFFCLSMQVHTQLSQFVVSIPLTIQV